jgi:DNA-directed RNA polymerase specialized sigma24 family protein
MKSRSKVPLVGSDGQPLPERIQRALNDLLPRFNRWFPLTHDEAFVIGLLEEAGQRITDQERRSGPLERLHGFAWTVLRNIGVSELRLSRSKVQLKSLGSAEGELLMSRMNSDQHGPTALEGRLAIEQALQQVTDLERRVALLKAAQFTSAEIAGELGTTVGAVDQAYFRAKHKLRKLLGPQKERR